MSGIIVTCIVLTILILIAIRMMFGPKRADRNIYPKDYDEMEQVLHDEMYPSEPGLTKDYPKIKNPYAEIELGPTEMCRLTPPINAPLIQKGKNRMSRFTAFLLGATTAACVGLTVSLGYFLFCPHAKEKVVVLTPIDQIPNQMLPDIDGYRRKEPRKFFNPFIVPEEPEAKLPRKPSGVIHPEQLLEKNWKPHVEKNKEPIHKASTNNKTSLQFAI